MPTQHDPFKTAQRESWTPEGVVGELLRASAACLPPPPEYASPPILWEREDHVREMFKGAAASLRFKRFGELRARVLEIWRRANEATDGRLRLPQEYLVSVIHV